MSPNQCNMTCQCVSGVKRHTFKNGVFYIPLFVIFFLRNFRYPRAPALSHFSTKLHESFQTLSFFLFLFHYIISLHPQWNQAMFTLYWVQTSPISFVALRVQQRKQAHVCTQARQLLHLHENHIGYIQLLFTHKNGDFGGISETERNCAQPNPKVERHISAQ